MWQQNRFIRFTGQPDPEPTVQARLDREHYTGHKTMAAEWDGVWTKTWLLAGIERDLSEPGDFITFDVGRESILVTRTGNGDLSAVYNVCQHRGNRLQMLSNGSVGDTHTCPYHGWSYHLDGRLESVPDRERFSVRPNCERHSLKPVRVAARNGLVWINMDPDARSLDDFLGPILDELAPYRIEDMLVVRDQTCTLDANWKTVIDNFSEVYHVDFIHAQHASFVNCRDASVDLYPYGHTAFRVEGYQLSPRYPLPDAPPPILAGAMEAIGLDPAEYRNRLHDVRAAAQRQKRKLGREMGFDYSLLSDAQVTDIWQYNLFPNVIMTVKPEEVWIMQPRPHPKDPERCFFDKITLAMPIEQSADGRSLALVGDPHTREAMASGIRPEREVFTQDDVNRGAVSMTETVDQDIFYLPFMQAGMNSAGFDQAVLSEDENRVSHFHDWLATWLAGVREKAIA